MDQTASATSAQDDCNSGTSTSPRRQRQPSPDSHGNTSSSPRIRPRQLHPTSPPPPPPTPTTSPFSQITSPPRSPDSLPPAQPSMAAAPAPVPAPAAPVPQPQHSQPSLWSIWSGRQQRQSSVSPPASASPSPPPQQIATAATIITPATPVWSVNPHTDSDSASISDDGTTLSELVLNLSRGGQVNDSADQYNIAPPVAVAAAGVSDADGRIMYSRSNDGDEDDSNDEDDTTNTTTNDDHSQYAVEIDEAGKRHTQAHYYGRGPFLADTTTPYPPPAPAAAAAPTDIDTTSLSSISHLSISTGGEGGSGGGEGGGNGKFASPATMAAGTCLLSSEKGSKDSTPSSDSRRSRRSRRRWTRTSSDGDNSDDDEESSDQQRGGGGGGGGGGFFPIFKSPSERSSSASWSRSQGGGAGAIAGGSSSYQSGHSAGNSSQTSSLGLPPPPPPPITNSASANLARESFRQILSLDPPQPDQDSMDRPLSPPVRSPQSASLWKVSANAEGAELIPALPVDTRADFEGVLLHHTNNVPDQTTETAISSGFAACLLATQREQGVHQYDRSGSLSSLFSCSTKPSHKPTYSSTSISSPPIPGTSLLSSGSSIPSHRPAGSITSIASPPIPRAPFASKVWSSPEVSPPSSPPPSAIIAVSSASHATSTRPTTEKLSSGNTTLALDPSGSSGAATGASCEGADRRYFLAGRRHGRGAPMPGREGPARCRWRPLILFLVFLTLFAVLVSLMAVRNRNATRSSSGIPEDKPLPIDTTTPTPEPAKGPSAEASPPPSLRPITNPPAVISTIWPVPTATIETVPPPAETPSTSLPVTSAPATTTAPSPTTLPLLTAAPTSVDDALYNLILEAAPNSAALAIQEEASPQAFAFNWMIYNTLFGNHSQERILQRYALTVLYFSAEGDGWTNNTNWLVHEDECQWFNKASLTTVGGSCTDTGLLLALDLSRNSLKGALPEQEEFALLTELVVINFNQNPLTGAIPPPLLQGGGILPNLERIDLANTNMDGPLLDNTLFFSPEPALRRLNLAGTPVTGSVPLSWGVFVNLQDLLLHGTSLTGAMPQTVCENQNLTEVSANCDEILNCTCCTICCFTNVVQRCEYVNN